MHTRHFILAFIALIIPPGFGWQAGCWSLNNLRLLPAEENMAKSDSMEDYHDTIWRAICQVESSGNPDAHNPGEDARGIAQIRAIMVDDVNRIVGSDKYTHDDAWCAEKSREMFDIYNSNYHPKGDAHRISRCWNGGPTGHKKKATEKYWLKVKAELER